MQLSKWSQKTTLWAKFGVKDDWIFEVIPIINTPKFGDKLAEKVCIDLKIKSQKDKDKLVDDRGGKNQMDLF